MKNEIKILKERKIKNVLGMDDEDLPYSFIEDSNALMGNVTPKPYLNAHKNNCRKSTKSKNGSANKNI